ncbi:MAG: hypothetical protein ACXWT1_01455 [Methylobacter sp.]
MLAPDLLCLSHGESLRTADGRLIELRAGMSITAYDEDTDDDGNRDDIFASGIVEISPEFAQCQGSKWSLRIDSNGIRHESDLKNA